MAEDPDQERHLPASQRRLEKAREEGQVARSREAATCLVLAAASAAFAFSGPWLAARAAHMMSAGLQFDRATAFAGSEMAARLSSSALHGTYFTAPLLALAALAGLAGSLAIGGWVFSTAAFAFKPERLDPLRGLANLFSGVSLGELAKALVKAAAAGGIGWLVLDAAWPELVAMSFASPEPAAAHAGRLLAWGFMLLAGGFIAVAVADAPYALWRHARNLRMTRDEVRQEQKETEGDPQIKARVRSLRRQAARRRMMADVPRSDVVVTNPTHYAVALAYREGMRAPKVLAKGSDLVAARIREVAAGAGVPLLEAPPLARALHRHAEIGAEIPGPLYDAVAQVLAWVMQLRRARAAGMAHPASPGDIPVPPELRVVEETA